MEGVKVYDPRDNQIKVSDNPALIYADLVEREIAAATKRETFWLEVCNIANHCEAYE